MNESPDTPREGADPEDRTSGGSGGAQGPETSDSTGQMDQSETLGPGLDDQDAVTDRAGEPTTKPGASEQTPGQLPDADDPSGKQES